MSETGEKAHGGLTVLGLLSVVLGALWIIASFWALLQPQTIRAVAAQQGAPQILEGVALVWANVDAGLNIVLAVLLFAAGVGLLRLRAWGAKLGIGYAVARLALSAVSFVFTLLGPIAARPTGEALKGLNETFVRFMTTSFLPVALTEAVAALVLSSLFAVILLCLLTRPSYRQGLS